ncbi:hypothetical protein ACQ4PT_031289 [Festuca glaucescens]
MGSRDPAASLQPSSAAADTLVAVSRSLRMPPAGRFRKENAGVKVSAFPKSAAAAAPRPTINVVAALADAASDMLLPSSASIRSRPSAAQAAEEESVLQTSVIPAPMPNLADQMHVAVVADDALVLVAPQERSGCGVCFTQHDEHVPMCCGSAPRGDSGGIGTSSRPLLQPVLTLPTAGLRPCCVGRGARNVGSIKSRLDAAAIPATRKADLRKNVSELEDQIRKAKKKTGQENIQKAVKAAMYAAEAALSTGQSFCVAHVDVGLDTVALREAVVKCMNRVRIMLFSTDVASDKAVVYAGVPPEAPNGLEVLDWLTRSIAPLKGRGGGGKNGLAQGQGNDASRLKEAMAIATQIALKKTS